MSEQKKYRVLLTGSEGNICTSIVKPTLTGTCDIIPFDLSLGDDIRDPSSIDKKIDGIDIVIHTAAISGPIRGSKDGYENVNIKASVQLIKKAKSAGVRRFVFFSSLTRYGADSWGRTRDEIGSITGNDVAKPLYLPIDEAHQSILQLPNYDDLFDWGGKYYGASKASVEQFGESLADENFQFISLRLGAYREKYSEKNLRAYATILSNAQQGIAEGRKRTLFGMVGCCTPDLLKTTIHMLVAHPPKDSFFPINTLEANDGLHCVAKLYFPDVEPADSIFSDKKLMSYLESGGISYKKKYRFFSSDDAIKNLLPKENGVFRRMIQKIVRIMSP